MYDNIDDCIKNQFITCNTNPRYKDYHQDMYTMGDQEQFINEIGIPDKCIIDTFRYIFKKFKKGTFVIIKDNKVRFVPFDNHNFINDYDEHMSTDNIDELVKKVSTNDKQQVKPFIQWYSKNGIFRYENNKREIDKTTIIIQNMFETLCYTRVVKDCYFFINRRDFPWLRKDRTEAFDNIYECKQIEKCYQTFCPILSMTSNDQFDDICIPTWDDWTRVQSEDELYFSGCIKFNDSQPDLPFDERIPIAIFRGSITGIGYNIKTNPRLFISSIQDENIDAGITKINNRIRKIKGIHDPKIIECVKNINQKPYTSFHEQKKYKYIINISGWVSAFRLSIELNSGSVVLLQDQEYKLWFTDKLIPWTHYVPVKRDLSDVSEKVQWCIDNNEKCKEIVYNSKKFYKDHLTKDGILDYLQKVVSKIPKSFESKHWKPTKTTLIESHPIYKKLKNNVFSHDKYIYKFTSHREVQIYKLFQNYPFIPKLYNVKQIDENTSEIQIQKLDGITLFNFIKYKFNMKKMVNILIHLFSIFNELNEKYKFVHHDSYLWNIIIHNNKPYIIDFEKSCIQGMDCIVSVYNTHSVFIDVVNIIVNTFWFILKFNKLSKHDVNVLFKIIRYFDTSHFRKINTITNMINYFNVYKKFDYMSNFDTEEYTSFDLKDFCSFLRQIKI